LDNEVHSKKFPVLYSSVKNHFLTPSSRVLLRKVPVTHLVKFSSFYGTRSDEAEDFSVSALSRSSEKEAGEYRKNM
jgi:hypothetical protein